MSSLLSSSNAHWHCSAQLKGTSFLVSVFASVSVCLLGRVCACVSVLVCDRAGVCAGVCAVWVNVRVRVRACMFAFVCVCASDCV